MHQSAQKIASRILSELEPGQPYYTVSDFQSTSLPSSVCKQIQIALADKIQEDITQPTTAWANTESESVRNTWRKLQDEIFRHAHIRSARTKGFLEEVIQFFFEIYLEPRKNMGDFIFGSSDTLSYQELEQQVSKLTVNKHFGSAILKYMQKRELASLSKEKCSLLIKTLDENLASSYSNEEWEQVLSLLFDLFRDEVNAKLIAWFFVDKGRNKFAEIFTGMKEPVSRQKFREVLETPEAFLKANPPKEKTQADLFVDDDTDEGSSLFNQFMESSEEERAQAEEVANESDSFNALFKSEEEQEVFFDYFDESAGESEEFQVTAPGSTVPADLNTVKDEVEEEITPEEEEATKETEPEEENDANLNVLFQAEEVNETVNEEDELTPEDEEEAPIWQQFLDPDEAREEETEDESFAHHDFVEDIFGEEEQDETPVYSNTISLSDHLKSKESEYITLIFKGDKKKYLSAMEEIQNFENWEQASDYIQEDVFTPNTVDMFSDVAVDFTDQLQSYFDEYKS